MIIINKKIKNGYISFSEDVRNKSKIIERYGPEEEKNWGMTVEVYDTLKYMETSYFDFLNYEIDIQNIYNGSVLRLLNKVKIYDNCMLVFNEFYLITRINNIEVKMTKHDTIAKAVRAQREKALSEGFFLPIPKQSIWKKYQKHI